MGNGMANLLWKVLLSYLIVSPAFALNGTGDNGLLGLDSFSVKPVADTSVKCVPPVLSFEERTGCTANSGQLIDNQEIVLASNSWREGGGLFSTSLLSGLERNSDTLLTQEGSSPPSSATTIRESDGNSAQLSMQAQAASTPQGVAGRDSIESGWIAVFIMSLLGTVIVARRGDRKSRKPVRLEGRGVPIHS